METNTFCLLHPKTKFYVNMNREDFYRALQVIKDGPSLDAWTEYAYKKVELEKWHDNEYFTSSFHCSSFPGAEKNCRCRSLYKLLNIPEEKPVEPKGVGVMAVGKCVEEQIVERWYKTGIVLGPEPPEQLYIEDENTWLTGYIDAALNLLPEWPYVLPVEIKSKKNTVIEYMKI